MILADPPELEDVNGLRHAATASTTTNKSANRALVKLQHRHEGVLRNFHRADTLHPPLAFLLLFQQFAFPRHITAVALREHVLAHRGDRFAGDYFAPDRRLDRHLIQLARNDRLQLLRELAALHLRLAAVRDQRERVDGLA